MLSVLSTFLTPLLPRFNCKLLVKTTILFVSFDLFIPERSAIENPKFYSTYSKCFKILGAWPFLDSVNGSILIDSFRIGWSCPVRKSILSIFSAELRASLAKIVDCKHSYSQIIRCQVPFSIIKYLQDVHVS